MISLQVLAYTVMSKSAFDASRQPLDEKKSFCSTYYTNMCLQEKLRSSKYMNTRTKK